MSKADAKRAKQHKRELENLERGLRRGSVELVLDALLELPEAAAAGKLSSVQTLLVPKLEAACRGRDASSLQTWLRALGRESQLLERLAVKDDEVVWALLWAAMRAQNYKLSEQLWGGIAGRVRMQANASASAIDALIESRGHPDPELIPVVQEARDERLGVEPVGPRRASTAAEMPAEPGDVERRLVELRASEPWSNFAATARQWLARAPTLCAPSLCVITAELALLELRDAAGLPSDREAESAALVLAADRRFTELSRSETASHDSALQARLDHALALALRAAFARLCDRTKTSSPGEWVAAAIRQALRLPGLRGAVLAALSQSVACSALVPLAPVLRELYAETPSAALWARTALALDLALERRILLGRRPSDSSWDWVTSNLSRHLAAPHELIGAIAALNGPDRKRLFEMLGELLEPERAVDLVVGLWDGTEERQREPLIQLGREALAVASDLDFCEECDTFHFLDNDHGTPSRPLRWQAEQVLDRLQPLLIAHDELVLKLSLSRAQGRREQRALLDRSLSPGVPIDNYLGALEHARRLGLPPKPFRDRLRAQFSGQLSPLARGFELSLRSFGPRSIVSRELAELLVQAADQGRPGLLSTDGRERLEFARILVRKTKKVAKMPKQLSLGLETPR